MFDRLMGRSILTQTYTVVRKEVDHPGLRQRRQTHRRPHIVGKYQKGGGIGDKAAVQGHAGSDGAHGVFADTKMHVAPPITPLAAHGALRSLRRPRRGLKIAEPFEPRDRRGIEIGRPPHEFRDLLSKGLHHRFGGLPRGHTRGICLKGRQCGVPARGELTVLPAHEFSRLIRISLRVTREGLFPLCLLRLSIVHGLAELLRYLVGDEECRLKGPAEVLLGRTYFLFTQRRAVRVKGTLFMWRPITDNSAHTDERGAGDFVLGGMQRCVNGREVIAIFDLLHVPPIRLKTSPHIFGKGKLGRTGQRNTVVVEQADQFAEPEVSGQGTRLGCNSLHEITVAGDDIGIVIDDGMAGPIESSRKVGLGQRHAHRVADALAEGAGRNLDPGHKVTLRVSCRLTPPLAKRLQIGKRQIVSRQVEQGI